MNKGLGKYRLSTVGVLHLSVSLECDEEPIYMNVCDLELASVDVLPIHSAAGTSTLARLGLVVFIMITNGSQLKLLAAPE